MRTGRDARWRWPAVTVHQLHRTSAASPSLPGWRVTAQTPGLDPAVLQATVGLLTSELAVDARRTDRDRRPSGAGTAPGLGHGGEAGAWVPPGFTRPPRAGITLSYSHLGGGAAVICRTVDAGRDFAGRPGNVFQHALVLTDADRDLAGLLPADLWWWSGWSDGAAEGDLPEIGFLAVDGKLPWSAAADRARELVGGGRLATLLAGVRRSALDDPGARIVLVEPSPATTMATIRLATGSLPRALALAMTFNARVGHPEQARHMLVGVPVGAGLDSAAIPFGVRFETHRLYPGAAPPPAGEADVDVAWGRMAAHLWAMERPDILAAADAWFADDDAAARLAAAASGAGVPRPAATDQAQPGGRGQPSAGSRARRRTATGAGTGTAAGTGMPADTGTAADTGESAGTSTGTGTGMRAAGGAAHRSQRAGRPLGGSPMGATARHWTSRLLSAAAAVGEHGRGALLFCLGAAIAFGTLGGALLTLPRRTLAAEAPVLRPADGEAAYPAYFARGGQASIDLAALRDAVASALRTAGPAFATVAPVRWPGPAGGTSAVSRRRQRRWAAGTATGVAAAGGFARAALAVHRGLVAGTIAGLWAAAAALRLLETALWVFRETRPLPAVAAAFRRLGELGVDCPYPDCARPLGRPFYQCSNEACGRRHDDLRPGRGGLLFRVCACGTRLRTWAPGRRGRLASFCGSCSGRLPDGVGHLPIVHVALIGPPASGKTTLLVATLAGLHDRAYQGDVSVSFAFRQDEEWYQRSMRLVAEGSWLESTPTPNPRALVVTVGIPHGPRRIVFFFDPDGDLYTDQETLRTTHRYLGRTHNALLVVDPSAQPALLTRLTPEQRQEALDTARPASEPTYDTMRRLIKVLRADRSLPQRSGRISLRLAVVVSKTDWLRGLPPVLRLPDLRPEQEDILVRQWLTRPARLPELALQPSMEFTETRYWALSAADCLRGRNGQIDLTARAAAAEPVLWMLAASARRFRRLVTRQQNQQAAAGRTAGPRAQPTDRVHRAGHRR